MTLSPCSDLKTKESQWASGGKIFPAWKWAEITRKEAGEPAPRPTF